MQPEPDNPYAPPKAPVQDIAPPDAPHTLPLALRRTRLWALLVDMVPMIAVLALLNALTPWEWLKPEPDVVDTLLNLVVGLSVFLALHGWFLATRGQTLGKALLRLRMVRPDGSPASFARLAGLRYSLPYVFVAIPVVGLLYSLVDCLCIFGKARRCLHDRIADTVVVVVRRD